jgi:predicted protein tyrosine phosphatase
VTTPAEAEEDVRLVFLSDLAGVPERVLELGPAYMVSLLDPEDKLAGEFGQVVRLRLDMRDIDWQDEGGPSQEAVVELIAFLRAVPPGASLLVHCHAGVSRSTAAFLIAHAVRYGTGSEALEAARSDLEREEPWAMPNPLLLRLADRELHAEGRLVRLGRAIRAAADARALEAEARRLAR